MLGRLERRQASPEGGSAARGAMPARRRARSGAWGVAGKGGKREARRTVQPRTDKRLARRILPPAASGIAGGRLRRPGGDAGQASGTLGRLGVAGKRGKREARRTVQPRTDKRLARRILSPAASGI